MKKLLPILFLLIPSFAFCLDGIIGLGGGSCGVKVGGTGFSRPCSDPDTICNNDGTCSIGKTPGTVINELMKKEEMKRNEKEEMPSSQNDDSKLKLESAKKKLDKIEKTDSNRQLPDGTRIQ